MKKRITLRESLVTLAALPSLPVTAATVTVNTLGDAFTYGSDTSICFLREAFASINLQRNYGCLSTGVFGVDDRIVFDPALNGNTLSLVSDVSLKAERDLTIQGPGSDLLTIQASSAQDYAVEIFETSATVSGVTLTGSPNFSAIKFLVGDSSLTDVVIDTDNQSGAVSALYTSLSIQNSTLTNNSLGIFNLGSDLTIIDSTISSNSPNGGVSVVENASLIVESTDIENNYSSTTGGAIRIDDNASLTVRNSTLSANSANGAGGAIHAIDDSSVDVVSSRLYNNVSGSVGGAISITGFAGYQQEVLTINNSLVSENRSQSAGGGIYVKRANLSLLKTTVEDNYSFDGGGLHLVNDVDADIVQSSIFDNSSQYGGGISLQGESGFSPAADILNTTISENSAVSRGGGIQSDDGFVRLTNNTIAKNSATVSAGGVFLRDSAGFIYNNIISGNGAVGTNEIVEQSSTIFNGYNLIGQSSASTSKTIAGFTLGFQDILASSDGALATPLNAIIDTSLRGQLAFHELPEKSPAVDKGTGALCPQNDQLGKSRFDQLCDIGAIEFEPTSCFVVKTQAGSVVTFCL